MNYEIVSLSEKTLVGLGLKSSNSDPQLGEKIGGLWELFCEKNLCEKIKNKKTTILFVFTQIIMQLTWQILINSIMMLQ